jgi:hypothetical protein
MMLSKDEELVRVETRAWRIIKQVIEQSGLYIFFVSAILLTQIHVVKKYAYYNEIEVRIVLAVVAGILVAYGASFLIKQIFSIINKDSKAFLAELSSVMSPGILFVFASANKSYFFIGVGFCILSALIVWVSSVRSFVCSIVYEDKFKTDLVVKDQNALIKITGTYEKADLMTVQSFLIDLALNFHECAQMGIFEVKLDVAELKGDDAKGIPAMIEPIAAYFNIYMHRQVNG